MLITKVAETLEEIDLNPATTEEEVAQNVAALAATPLSSVPLLRGMGLPMAFKDRPMTKLAAELLYEEELREAADEYEPRANVVSSTTSEDALNSWSIETVGVKVNG